MKASWGFENIVVLQCQVCGRKHFGLNEAQYQHCLAKFGTLKCVNNRCIRGASTLKRLR